MNAQNELINYFLRDGFFRIPNAERMKEGHRKYKKGYEIRFTALNRAEQFSITRLLDKMNFKYGKPYKKRNQIIIPVYGKENFIEFNNAIKKSNC